MHAGRVACRSLARHDEYANGPDRQTDGRTPERYINAFRYSLDAASVIIKETRIDVTKRGALFQNPVAPLLSLVLESQCATLKIETGPNRGYYVLKWSYRVLEKCVLVSTFPLLVE